MIEHGAVKPEQVEQVLIIACSGRKKSSKEGMKLFDLYDGQTFRLLKSNGYQPGHKLGLMILSAKHGLIDCRVGATGDEAKFHSYDEVINKALASSYVERHREGIVACLQRVSAGTKVHVVMPKPYLEVIDSVLSSGALEHLSYSFLRNARGNGDHQQYIKRLLDTLS